MENQLGECSICNLRGLLSKIRVHMKEEHLIKDTIETVETEENSIEFEPVEDDCIRWAPHEVLLIRLVEENLDKFNAKIKKNVWIIIAEKISSITKKKFTHEQVDNKWKGMKKTFKRIKDENNRSGNSPVKWEFFNAMDSFMRKRPEITPIATCDTKEGLQLKQTMDENMQVTTQNTDNNGSSSFFLKRKRRNNEVQKRHYEKIARFDQFLKLYKQSLKLKAKKQ
ncbi:hypothetical protein ABEB36_008013 [Hypothenemus hampei]|uniref:Myb/SANT-like DNA-binding domain-containing protein n=1 Tax=Hypothenemus hampei TaxID=57062 RepID=A0ABD1EPG6_HYPHA